MILYENLRKKEREAYKDRKKSRNRKKETERELRERNEWEIEPLRMLMK